TDLGLEAVRLADLLRPLAGSPARAKVVIVDAARPSPFTPQGRGLARGLIPLEPAPGMLIAFSSAPGTVAPDGQGPYGAYSTAIAEMVRAPGLDLEAVFIQIRSRTHQTTEGQQTPWHASALCDQIVLVPAEAAAVGIADAPQPLPPPRVARPMREIGPTEGYALAVERDTLEDYVAFVEAYPQ